MKNNVEEIILNTSTPIFTDEQKKIYISAIQKNNFNSLGSFIDGYLYASNDIVQTNFINKINSYIELIGDNDREKLTRFFKIYSYAQLEIIGDIITNQNVKKIYINLLMKKIKLVC